MRDSKRDTDVQNSLLDSVGEGKGGKIWENGIETCILSYVEQMASPGSMHETGCLGLVHCDDPEGWDGEGTVKGCESPRDFVKQSDSDSVSLGGREILYC